MHPSKQCISEIFQTDQRNAMIIPPGLLGLICVDGKQILACFLVLDQADELTKLLCFLAAGACRQCHFYQFFELAFWNTQGLDFSWMMIMQLVLSSGSIH